MVRTYRSRKYKLPMPYSLFYRGGYAIHGTDATAMLVARRGTAVFTSAPAMPEPYFAWSRSTAEHASSWPADLIESWPCRRRREHALVGRRGPTPSVAQRAAVVMGCRPYASATTIHSPHFAR